jgi:hypothetical protein
MGQRSRLRDIRSDNVRSQYCLRTHKIVHVNVYVNLGIVSTLQLSHTIINWLQSLKYQKNTV